MTKKLSECTPEEAARLRERTRLQNAKYPKTEAGQEARKRARRVYYAKHREHLLAGMREYAATEEGRAAHVKASQRWQRRNPEKMRAQGRARYALSRGYIERQGCETCGAPAEMHHDDYSKPLEVRWFCRQHHKDHHRKDC